MAISVAVEKELASISTPSQTATSARKNMASVSSPHSLVSETISLTSQARMRSLYFRRENQNDSIHEFWI